MSLGNSADVKNEIQTDPVAIGYGTWAGTSDDGRIHGLMNDPSKRAITNIVISSQAILALMDPTEYAALTDIKLQQLNVIFAPGTVNLGQQNIRSILTAILPAAGASAVAIGAYYLSQVRTQSRLAELGWSLAVADITWARTH